MQPVTHLHSRDLDSGDLRYPIGPPSLKDECTDTERAAFIDDIVTLPSKFEAAVAGLTEAQLDTPYRPEGWTVRQLVHHMADSHMNAYVRWKLALTEDMPTVKPYDEAEWAKLKDSALPIDISLNLLSLIHQRWAVVLENNVPADFSRKVMHPENGVMTLDRMAALYSWHGKHHTAHITSLRQRNGW